MRPTTKITAVALGGAVATILAWLVAETTAVEMPPPVVAALTTLLAFGFGYLKREPR